MALEVETADKGGNDRVGLGGEGAVWRDPACCQGSGDGVVLIAGLSQIGFDGPAVAVLRVDRGVTAVVVDVKTLGLYPGEVVGGGLDAFGGLGPVGDVG